MFRSVTKLKPRRSNHQQKTNPRQQQMRFATVKDHPAKSPLEKHVEMFTDDKGNFSPSTISKGLTEMHSSAADVKGLAIGTFNATHSSDGFFPVSSATFTKDPCAGFAKYLHLGTTRIWNADGTVNEENWAKFLDYVKNNQNGDNSILRKDTLINYLSERLERDPEETNSGRNAIGLFSSKTVQSLSATAAWGEVFDRLAAGEIENPTNPGTRQPYINMVVVREFFDDSTAAFEKAKNKTLPGIKPTV